MKGKPSIAGRLASASVLAGAFANLRVRLRKPSIARPLVAGANSWRGGRRVTSVVGLLWSPLAMAQEATRPFAAPATVNSAAPSGIASLGQVTLALALVLALIFVAAWAMRRMRGFGKTGTGALDIIADLPLGQKERAVLIRVGTQQVLLGVAPGRVSTLHVLSEPVNIAPPVGSAAESVVGGAERPTFKSLLLKSLGK
jgi:flagellar protein FliO/FliZ